MSRALDDVTRARSRAQMRATNGRGVYIWPYRESIAAGRILAREANRAGLWLVTLDDALAAGGELFRGQTFETFAWDRQVADIATPEQAAELVRLRDEHLE